jgi:SepF-like predicted cell division protein (DUF552 family)
MPKKMLQPEDIRKAIESHVFNSSPPDDELGEIGGKHVSMDGIRDIEIDSQTESDSGFIVTGSATLDVDTDLGDGDGFSDSYPMTFSYEFDESGRILRQLQRDIDTSSFFVGSEDIYGDLVGTTGSSQFQVFQDSMLDIQNLLHRTDTPGAFVRRLLYVHVVTALESYLFDFLAAKVLKDDASMRHFIEASPTFQNQTLKVSELFKTVESIKKRIQHSLEKVNWHHPEDAAKLYVKVLGITLPSDLNQVKESIRLRNILVHRNGKLDDDTVREVGEQDVLDAMQAAEALVNHIEDQWRKTQNVAGPALF